MNPNNYILRSFVHASGVFLFAALAWLALFLVVVASVMAVAAVGESREGLDCG